MKRRFSRSALLAAVLAAPLLAAPKTARFALILADPPAVKAMHAGGRRDSLEVLSARQSIQQKQASLKSQLKAKGFPVTGSTTTLLNAVFVAANPTDVASLRAMAGVKAVFLLPKRHLKLNAAAELLDAPAAWTALGGTANAGAGIKIGIIDTGIDQTHPAFQDSSLTVPAGFPKGDTAYTNNKVIVARSYVSLDAQAYGAAPDLDTPDDTTPRDRVGHGTAVAMCAGGNTNTGPAATITGLAPKAFLGNYKIYGSPGIIDFASSDAIIQAVEDAFNDGMDVANLSSGGPALSGPLDTGSFCETTLGSTQCDPEAIAIENAVQNNMVVVVAAGNEGYNGYFGDTTYTEPYATIDSPGYAPSAIAVAATGNSHIGTQSVSVTGPSVPSNLVKLLALQDNGSATPNGGAFTAPLLDASTVGDLYGCNAYPANSMTGDIALIERGGANGVSCSFDLKIVNAQAAGAVGVLFYNNGQTPDLISPNDSDFTVFIPGFLVGTTDGQNLKAYVDANPGLVSVTLNPAVGGFTESSDTNQVTYFSSHGPALGGGLKPDVAAPGENIYMATQDLDPNGVMYDPTRYTVQAGTSFSTPMVAGIAALVRQQHPTWTALQVKSAIVNTATADTTDPFVTINSSPSSVFSVGGGKAEALSAIQTNVTVIPSTLSLGQYTPTTTTISATQTLTITNQSSGNQNLTLGVIRTNADAATQITLSPTSLALSAGKSGTVTVTFTGTKPAAGIYEGAVTITGGAQPLHVPYGYTVGDGVPSQMYFIAGDGDVGIVGEGTSEGFLAVQVIDQFGVPVANLPALWSAVDGGSFTDTGTNTFSYSTTTDQYGQTFATPILGTTDGGTYTFHLHLTNFVDYDFTDYAYNAPTVGAGGAVNAASYALGQGIAPGSYISLFGTELASFPDFATTVPLPISIDAVSVGFDAGSVSVPGALSYVDPGQINVQVPWELAGQSSVAIKVNFEPLIGAVINVPLATYSPAVFAPANNIAAAEDLNYQIITTSNPAVQGQYAVVYCNGLGPVSNQPATGAISPSNPLANTSSPVTATIGGQPATVQFAGLTPGLVGLYQVNVLVPTGLTTGNQPLVLTVGGVSSPSVLLPVK